MEHNISWIARSSITRSSLCQREGNDVVGDNTSHRGARMLFLIKNSIDILEEHQNVDGDHDTFAERFHEDVIDPRSHQVKRMMKQEVIGTIGTTQT